MWGCLRRAVHIMLNWSSCSRQVLMVHLLHIARIWALFNHAGANEGGCIKSAIICKDLMIVVAKFFVVWMSFLGRLNLCTLKCQSTVHPDFCKKRQTRCFSVLCRWEQDDHLVSISVWQDECDFKIKGQIVTFMLDTSDLDYCITLLILLSCVFLLIGAVLGDWTVQIILAWPVLRSDWVLWFSMMLMI